MNKTAKALRFVIALFLILGLIPIKFYYKDGGSVCYKAVLYEVTKWHQLSDDLDGYKDGLQIKILGLIIYDKYFE